jgi:hypothetical protein
LFLIKIVHSKLSPSVPAATVAKAAQAVYDVEVTLRRVSTPLIGRRSAALPQFLDSGR